MIGALRYIKPRTIHAAFEVAVVALILFLVLLWSQLAREVRNLNETLTKQHQERMNRMDRMERGFSK